MKFRSHQIRLCIFFTFEIVFWIRIIMNYTLLVEFEITHIQKYPRRICRSAILKYGRIDNRNWNRRIIFIVLFYRPLYEEFNPRREKNKNSERSWWASIPRKISRVSKSNWRSTRWAGVLASKNLLLHSSRGRTSTFYFITASPSLILHNVADPDLFQIRLPLDSARRRSLPSCQIQILHYIMIYRYIRRPNFCHIVRSNWLDWMKRRRNENWN